MCARALQKLSALCQERVRSASSGVQSAKAFHGTSVATKFAALPHHLPYTILHRTNCLLPPPKKSLFLYFVLSADLVPDNLLVEITLLHDSRLLLFQISTKSLQHCDSIYEEEERSQLELSSPPCHTARASSISLE